MAERYRVIPRTLIFIFHEGRVLLLRGAMTKKNFPGLYNGLGGHVEHGETILDGAARELFEESGLSGVFLELCGISMDSTHPDAGVEVHIFRGDLSHPQRLRESSEGTLEWVSREALAHLEGVPDLVPFLDRIWNRKHGDRVFFARVDWSAADGDQIFFT